MNDESNLRRRLRAEWEDMAEEWIRLHAKDELREVLLDGWMLRAAGDVSGLRVIDLGCGEGRFARMLAESGARVTGVDLCRPFIEYAECHRVGSETYLFADMEDLDGVPDDAFDLAVSYISLVDVLDMPRAVSSAFRVMRSGGRFVVCNVHPMRMASVGWIRQGDVKLHYPVDNYFDESAREMRSRGGKPWTNFHRTLETHVRTFLDAGFTIEAIQEPTPTQEQAERHHSIDDELRVPNFIIFVLRKPISVGTP